MLHLDKNNNNVQLKMQLKIEINFLFKINSRWF